MEAIDIIDPSSSYLSLLGCRIIRQSMYKSEGSLREMLFGASKALGGLEGPQLVSGAQPLGLKSWSCREPCSPWHAPLNILIRQE